MSKRAPSPADPAAAQFRVIKDITQALGRKLAAGASEGLGRPVPVFFAYEEGLRKKGALTVVQVALSGRGGNAEREYERAPDGTEQFRNPPLLLRAHYLISAWDTPPEDQVLLGVAIRTLHDDAELQTEGDEEHTVSYDGRPSLELRALPFEEHKARAEAFQMPIAPSVELTVDFVIRSARLQTIKRVKERVMDFRKIDG